MWWPRDSSLLSRLEMPGSLANNWPAPRTTMKHIPFESIYREQFEVVEERHGRVSLYPHTDQLPLLLRAVNLEFLGGLPDRFARVDKRASGFDKMVRGQAALMFCTFINGARKDQLRLFDLPDPDLVSRVTIVQQISTDEPMGRTHRFRFFGGDDFFPEIRLSGKRVVFADHVLQRFSLRAANHIGDDLVNPIMDFFGSPIISMPVSRGRAFIVGCSGSILAFTYRESADEYFITTCLSINEINHLTLEPVPQVHNLHYGDTFTKPRYRTWMPAQWAREHHECWQKRVQFKPYRPNTSPAIEQKVNDWHWMGQHIKEATIKQGYGPGSQICFVDHIPGPCVTITGAGRKLPQYDELQTSHELDSKIDLDAIFNKLDAEGAKKRNV